VLGTVLKALCVLCRPSTTEPPPVPSNMT
jgi:hypothetical protein